MLCFKDPKPISGHKYCTFGKHYFCLGNLQDLELLKSRDFKTSKTLYQSSEFVNYKFLLGEWIKVFFFEVFRWESPHKQIAAF